MPFWESISNAFSNLWDKLNNQNTNSTQTQSRKDDYNKRRSVVSSSEGNRQIWQPSKQEERAATNVSDAWGYSRSESFNRAERMHSGGYAVPTSQSKPPSTNYPYRNSIGTSFAEPTVPRRSSTSPAPEISPRPAYSSSCGCKLSTANVLSSGELAGIQRGSAAVDRKATPLPASYAHLEHNPRPSVTTQKNNVQTYSMSSVTIPQVKYPSATLAEARHPQQNVAQYTVDQRTFSINAAQPQLRRSLTTPESSRRLVPTERALPSATQATRRNSANELVPEKNRIPKSQLQALNKHINSYYVQNIRKCEDVDDDYTGDQEFSYRNSCLPYRPDQVNVWFRAVVTRRPSTEPEGFPLRAHIDMINLIKTGEFKTMLTAVAKFRSICLEDGEELYFHATDAESAKSILESGIDITKSRSKEDFSNGYGFYVTPDYATSVDWATRKARKFCHSTGAIIAFKVSRELQKEQVHLFLEVNTAEGKRKWEKTVSHFRNGEAIGALSVLLQSVKFIRGPVSKNAFLRPGEIPVAYDFNFTQICICDEEYASRYGSLRNICFVIFFKVD